MTTIVFQGEAKWTLLDLAADSNRSVGDVIAGAIALQIHLHRHHKARLLIGHRRWFGLRTDWREIRVD